MAKLATTTTWLVKLVCETESKIMTTISAERIKSVRIAPLILSFSKCNKSSLDKLRCCKRDCGEEAVGL